MAIVNDLNGFVNVPEWTTTTASAPMEPVMVRLGGNLLPVREIKWVQESDKGRVYVWMYSGITTGALPLSLDEVELKIRNAINGVEDDDQKMHELSEESLEEKLSEVKERLEEDREGRKRFFKLFFERKTHANKGALEDIINSLSIASSKDPNYIKEILCQVMGSAIDYKVELTKFRDQLK